MQVTINRDTLTTALTVVSCSVNKRHNKIPLRSVRLHASGDSVSLFGTDLETGLRIDVEAVDVGREGSALLPAEHGLQIVKGMTGEQVTLTWDDGTIALKDGQSEFDLPTAEPAEFPWLSVTTGGGWSIDCSTLDMLIERTAFCTDVESTRYALGGCLFEIQDNILTLAATDSRRLSWISGAVVPDPGVEPLTTTTVVNQSALNILRKHLAGQDDRCHFSADGKEAVFKTSTLTMTTRLIEGRFPDYRRVEPTHTTYTFNQSVSDLLTAVRQSLIMTDEITRGVDYTFTQGQLSLSTSSERGKSDVVAACNFPDDSVSVTLDSKYLLDYLKTQDDAAQVTWCITDEDNPVVLKSEPDHTYVVMPLSRDR